MGHTIRYRFVALDLAEGWIDMGRAGLWRLRHSGRKGDLTLSVFPVAEGVTMDLATLQHLEHERRRHRENRTVSFASRFLRGPRFLDETSWSVGSVFCLATRGVLEPLPWAHLAHAIFIGHWTVCDGRYVLEASLTAHDADEFGVGVKVCDTMMRSVRFEGPS